VAVEMALLLAFVKGGVDIVRDNRGDA